MPNPTPDTASALPPELRDDIEHIASQGGYPIPTARCAAAILALDRALAARSGVVERDCDCFPECTGPHCTCEGMSGFSDADMQWRGALTRLADQWDADAELGGGETLAACAKQLFNLLRHGDPNGPTPPAANSDPCNDGGANSQQPASAATNPPAANSEPPAAHSTPGMPAADAPQTQQDSGELRVGQVVDMPNCRRGVVVEIEKTQNYWVLADGDTAEDGPTLWRPDDLAPVAPAEQAAGGRMYTQAEIAPWIDAAVAGVREAALERAAAICDEISEACSKVYEMQREAYHEGGSDMLDTAAVRIRALIGEDGHE